MLGLLLAAQMMLFARWASIAAGFSSTEAGAVGIIGGADGPTAIYVASQINPWGLFAAGLAVTAAIAVLVYFRRKAHKNRN